MIRIVRSMDDEIYSIKVTEFEIADCDYTRDGYTFTGWSMTPDGEVEYQPGDEYTYSSSDSSDTEEEDTEDEDTDSVTAKAAGLISSIFAPMTVHAEETTEEESSGSSDEEDDDDSSSSYHGEVGSGFLVIIKVDSETGEYLEGANFALHNGEGEYINSYTTNEEAWLSTNALTYDTYYFIETEAPEGYILDSDPVYVSLTKELSYSPD